MSTDRQRERQTIASQLTLLPAYAEREGWKVVDTYKDDGKSGETVEGRPEFQRLLDDAEEGRLDVVLVIDIDRITRSKQSAQGALIFDHFRKHRVQLATPSGGLIDLNDESQDLMVGILREVAKWEKRHFLKRTARGKREAAKQGRRVPGLDPYGLRWVFSGGQSSREGSYQIVREEAAVVRRAYELALTEGISMVAWTLNQEGNQTRAMKRATRPNGEAGPWAATSVSKILHSTVYKGEYRVFKKSADPITVKVPTIIDRNLWARVQSTLTGRRPEKRYQHKREYLLSGILKCGICGSHCWVVNSRPGHARHAYYRCSSTNAWRKMRMDGPCGQRHHRVDLVDAAVWTKLTEVLGNPSLLAAACALAEQPQGVDWEAQQKSAQRKLHQLVKLEGELLARRRRELISEAACDHELGEIARERDLTQRNLRVAEQQLNTGGSKRRLLHDLSEHAQLLARKIERATFEERRQLVRLVVPVEYGARVQLNRNGSIEIFGVLAMPGAQKLDLKLTTIGMGL